MNDPIYFSDNRVGIPSDQLDFLLGSDLKLSIKVFFITKSHLLSVTEYSTPIFKQLLFDNQKSLRIAIEKFYNELNSVGIEGLINIVPLLNASVFEPPLADRICLFARNGIFMDTFSAFSTRDIPLNTVLPFRTEKESYFILEHTHEAIEISSVLRYAQINYLINTNQISIDKAKKLKEALINLWKCANAHHLIYESMLE